MNTNICKESIAPFVVEGFVSAQRHPDLPLTIYNYTPKTQFSRRWTPVTMACRGLILADDGSVVARPFPKFFNLEEMSKSWNPPSKTFTVTAKEDGSLGILYRTDDGYAIATRGSFGGMQAIKATEMFREHWTLPWDTDHYTYLFEVIYPENRIVVDYGDTERLVMLAVIETKTGKDVELPAWYPHHVRSYPDVTDFRSLRDRETPNAEGFVIRFANGFRVKVKFTEYVRLHRLLTGVNARKIWEIRSTGGSMDELLTRVPDEFYEWVKRTNDGLSAQFDRIRTDALLAMHQCPRESRKESAAYISQQGALAPVMFAMLDEKGYDAIIWKQIKPRTDRPFRADDI